MSRATWDDPIDHILLWPEEAFLSVENPLGAIAGVRLKATVGPSFLAAATFAREERGVRGTDEPPTPIDGSSKEGPTASLFRGEINAKQRRNPFLRRPDSFRRPVEPNQPWRRRWSPGLGLQKEVPGILRYGPKWHQLVLAT